MEENLFGFWTAYGAAAFELVKDIITSLVIIAAGLVLNRLARRLIKKAAAAKSGLPGLAPDDMVTSVMLRIVSYGIFIIAVIMILTAFGINTASLIAVLGAAGVAVGLALKDTLGNIAAGIIILFLGSYRRGEYIEFGSYSGSVRDINLFTTILETPDGIYVSAPNSSVWNTPLKNYSRNGKRRMDLSVGISYSDSLDTAFRVMGEIAAGESRFMKEPAPQVLLQSLGESSVNIMLRAWASTGDYWNIYWDQTRNIKIRIEEAGLHIPFPQRDLHIINAAPPEAPGPASS
ncbi:MAG: mechanosensitive ion channel family protein [Treponema sp.]|jgi:small conductance mechanosensitive channel|nr:mechanosensitive ion channel family protein [Treponema sp.]